MLSRVSKLKHWVVEFCYVFIHIFRGKKLKSGFSWKGTSRTSERIILMGVDCRYPRDNLRAQNWIFSRKR